MRTKIVVPIMPETLEDVAALSAADYPLADIIEWRADYLAPIDVMPAVPMIFKAFSEKPILFTARTRGEGGMFPLEGTDYTDFLVQLMDTMPPTYLDVEYFTDPTALARLRDFDDRVVLSYHNFNEVPENLEQRLDQLSAAYPAYIKIAVSPNSTADVVRLMTISQRFTSYHSTPLISIAMGPLGRLTRIAQQLTGSPWSFAASDGDSLSAAGQLTARETRTILDILEK